MFNENNKLFIVYEENEPDNRTLYYKFEDGKLITSSNPINDDDNSLETEKFTITGKSAIWDESHFLAFADEETNAIRTEIFEHLVKEYPKTLDHLKDTDLSKLHIIQIRSYTNYIKQ